MNNVDLESDVYITEGVLDVLDHSAPDALFGAKIGIDATGRRPDEKPRPMPASRAAGKLSRSRPGRLSKKA